MKNNWGNNGILILFPPDDHLIRVGNLIVDLVSFEEGFKVEIRYRKDIWDYIQYRESLNVWPTSNQYARKVTIRYKAIPLSIVNQ